MQIHLKSILRRIAIAISALVIFFSFFVVIAYISLPDIRPLIHNNPTTTAFIELRRAEASRKGTKFELQRKWVPITEISPFLINIILHTEDQKFWKHPGINWNQVKQALYLNWRERKIMTGGSTITQQVAKNLYLSPDRTLFRKLREFLIAQELERHLSKERILEIYLNIVEWGDGVFGAEAAAQHWFHRPAAELDLKESLNLALSLPNPQQRIPTKPSPLIEMEYNRLILSLTNEGIISHKLAIESLYLPH